MNDSKERQKKVKCLVWDLDNTVWDGILLEDSQVTLRDNVANIIQTLDRRGILQSIASKNDCRAALAKLQEFNLLGYFLYPQINWNSKAASIQTIAQELNLGLDAIAFIDDQPFERDYVHFSLPEVLCIPAADLNQLLNLPQMNPDFVTADAQRRRLMYLSDIERNRAEEAFIGPKEEFLATLDMVFAIRSAQAEDLRRAEELTVRTHQLNSTGCTFSYAELDALRQSPHHRVLIAELEDRYGTYGKIGLALVETLDALWTIKLLLMSCRVMSRGVGTLLLTFVMNLAKQARVRLRAEFIPNERNRMMYVTFKFAGFTEVEKIGNGVILESKLTQIQPYPKYVKLMLPE